MTILLLLAFFIGIRHALEPDHVATVLAVSSQTNSLTATARHGAMWGIGHTITLLIFSMILIGWQIEINDNLFLLLEFVVGFVLILMGVDVLRRNEFPFPKQNNKKQKLCYSQSEASNLTLKSLGIGLLHGAAGSGVIIALVTTTINSIYLKFLYIALFSIGLIISMALFSILVSIPLYRRVKYLPSKYIKTTTGILAILIGLNIIYNCCISTNSFLI